MRGALNRGHLKVSMLYAVPPPRKPVRDAVGAHKPFALTKNEQGRERDYITL